MHTLHSTADCGTTTFTVYKELNVRSKRVSITNSLGMYWTGHIWNFQLWHYLSGTLLDVSSTEYTYMVEWPSANRYNCSLSTDSSTKALKCPDFFFSSSLGEPYSTWMESFSSAIDTMNCTRRKFTIFPASKTIYSRIGNQKMLTRRWKESLTILSASMIVCKRWATVITVTSRPFSSRRSEDWMTASVL